MPAWRAFVYRPRMTLASDPEAFGDRLDIVSARCTSRRRMAGSHSKAVASEPATEALGTNVASVGMDEDEVVAECSDLVVQRRLPGEATRLPSAAWASRCARKASTVDGSSDMVPLPRPWLRSWLPRRLAADDAERERSRACQCTCRSPGLGARGHPLDPLSGRRLRPWIRALDTDRGTGRAGAPRRPGPTGRQPCSPPLTSRVPTAPPAPATQAPPRSNERQGRSSAWSVSRSEHGRARPGCRPRAAAIRRCAASNRPPDCSPPARRPLNASGDGESPNPAAWGSHSSPQLGLRIGRGSAYSAPPTTEPFRPCGLTATSAAPARARLALRHR